MISTQAFRRHRWAPAAHARIEALLDKEHFFDRPYRTLACAPDLGGRRITAWRGTKRRGVSFCVEEPEVSVPEAQSTSVERTERSQLVPGVRRTVVEVRRDR